MSSNDRTTKRTEAVSKKEIEALRSRLHNLQQKQKQTTNTNSDVLSEKTASSASSHHQHSKPLPVHVNSRGEHPPSNQHEMPAKLAVDLVPPPSEPVAESTELRPPQRGKPYDQDAARDFMRKQQLKRHAEKLNELKKIEQTVDLRKQRLKELQQKTRKIVETNLIRSRSKSRERSTANLTVEAEVHAHDERRKAVAVVDNATKPPSNSSKAAAKLAIQSRNITVRRRYDAEVPTKASDHIPVVVVTAHDVLNKSATTIQAAYRRYKHQQSLSTKSREPSKKYFPPAIESWQPNAPESTTKESNIPKWLLHGQSNPNNLNFINTLRRTMNMVETVPVPATAIQSKVDIGIQSDMHYLHVPNSLPYSNAAEAASSGGQLDLDKINELKLKPTTSSSNKSPTPPDSYSSDSGTSKNIPELMSSESPSVISTASKYNLDANSLKMQEMQLQPTNRSHSSNTSNTSSRRTIKKSSRTLFADVSSADQQVNTNSVNSDSSHRVAGGGEHGLIKIIASNSSNFSRDSSTRSNSLSPRVAGIMPDYVVLEESSPERISHSFANYKKNLELTKVQPTTPANGLSLKSRSQTNICDVTIGNPKSPSSGASSARTYRKSPTVMSIRSKSSEDDVPSSMARLTPTQLDAISSTSPKQSLISIRDSIDSIRPHFSSSKPKSQHSCARNGNDDERDASVHRNPKSDDEQQSTVAEEVRSRSSLTDSFLSELASKSAKSKSTAGSVKTFRPEPVQNGVPVQVATTTIVAPPSSDINLKFKAELHLLSDFNSSLVHLLAVEKSINNLSTPNMSSQQPKTVYQNQDTQTSLIAPADANARVTSSPNMTQAQNADSSSIGPLLSEASALSLNQTGFGLDDFSALSVLNGTVSDTTNLHMSTIPELVDDGNTSATGEFRLQFFEQLIKEEDARIDNMKMILKIRERSLLDRTKAELSWLEMRKKQLLETGKLQAATQVRQKQRGVLVHMQNEQHEMQRIKQLQKAASKERKSILVAQRNRIKSQLTDVGDVQSVAVKMKHTSTRHYRQLQHNSSIAERRLPTPLKVIQQTSLTQHHRKSNGTNNTTVSRRSSASTIQSDDLMGFTTSCYESSFSIVNSNTDAASDAKAGIGDIDRASDKGAGESSSSSTRSTRIISEAVQSSDHLNDNGADVEVAVTACSPRSISRAATESSSSSAAESVPSGSDHVADVLAQRRLQATTTTPLVNSDDGDSVPAHVAVEVSDAVNVVAATAAATTRTTVLVSTTAQLADGGRTDSRQTAVAVAATSAAGAIRTSQDGGGLVKHGDKIKRY